MNFSDISFSSVLEIFNNTFLAWGLIACGLAQLSKLFVEIIFYQKWRPSVLLETGGMPSSHSAFVTGTAAGVGLEMGFNHSEFAMAATLAFVVMYDASGIRRSAGHTSSRVNLISDQLPSVQFNSPLKESLGHTRLEVLVGSLFGPAIALPGIVFIGSPSHFLELLGGLFG